MQNAACQAKTPLLVDIEQQVARVLNHHSFSRSKGPVRLLSYLLQKLARDGGQPASQRELATVLGLSVDFDPVSNPLVRMHISKLRRMLKRYADGPGHNDPIRLGVPRNQYQLIAVANSERAGGLEGPHRLLRNGDVQRPVILVCEFSCEAGCPDGLASEMAFQLVAMLAEHTQWAAIGPVLRQRLDAEGLEIQDFAERCQARFALDGEILPGQRGLSLVVRVFDVPLGKVCWTDWLDEPSNRFDPHHKGIDEPSLLASRVIDKLCRFDAPGAILSGGHNGN